MTAVLAYGVQCSARFNNVLNAISLVIWLFIVGVGVFFAKGSNWNDFTPYGTSGVSARVLSFLICKQSINKTINQISS
jgi:amino acid transporter